MELLAFKKILNDFRVVIDDFKRVLILLSD